MSYNMTVLENIDQMDDPFGQMAIKKINFDSMGPRFKNVDYQSPRQAAKFLQESKMRVSELLVAARTNHVNQFK